MGGTSTDVARYDGDFDYVWEHAVGDAHLVAPALAIESVAAGGGSVCTFDRHAGLRVGPGSAGAHPGPACYGAGGPLTITDANLLLGRLSSRRFPIPIVPEQAEARADALVSRIAQATGERPGRDALLEGFLDIANERMADAIRGVSVRKGYDPADYALVAFGGAGGQHACGVAERLGIRTVLVPRDAGLLSALGIGHAAVERFAERQILRPFSDLGGTDLQGALAALEAEAVAAVAREGVPRGQISVRRRIASLRFVGQDTSLSVEMAGGSAAVDAAAAEGPHTPIAALAEAFRERYRAVFGHLPGDRPIELESLRVVASSAEAAEQKACRRRPTAPRQRPTPERPRKQRACGSAADGGRRRRTSGRGLFRARGWPGPPWFGRRTAQRWSRRVGARPWTAPEP
jgi:5-oxoprolinase (ATP-hydrolysing)